LASTPETPEIQIIQEQPHHEGSHENGVAPFIAFEKVTKSFGELIVLDEVSFYVNPGETLCILGRSGVGKSVSLQQIMGFLKPDSGKILVAGQDICCFDEEQMQLIRRKVTMVFQNGALFDSLSVGENVAFPLRERRELAEDQIQQIVNGLLEMVGVSGMSDLLPSDLSTGMKRSVAIARALSSQPNFSAASFRSSSTSSASPASSSPTTCASPSASPTASSFSTRQKPTSSAPWRR
jgi:phospholipid/cholesterol/gamma-HCH transport system ATP-binding protein